MPKFFRSDTFKRALDRFGAPVLILAVMALAYGWQISRLGFYWDDWAFVYRYQSLGIFKTIFYRDTRQLGVLALLPGFLFSADSPLRWHVYLLVLRWAGVLLMYWGLNRLWPGHRRSVALMALLFSVYPAFTQQSISVVYSLQFFTYAVFFVSLGLMILAQREPRRFWWLTIFALLTQGLHLFIVEYFVGLELIRPVVLFFLQDGTSFLQKAKKSLAHWVPYLLILGIYLAWRLGLFGGGFVTYNYKTITSLYRADPQGTLLSQSGYILQDVLQIILNIWQATIQPTLIDWSQPYNLVTLAVALVVTLGLILLLPRLRLDDLQTPDGSFQHQAIGLGLFTVIVGFIPAWFVSRHIIMPGYFGDRFALPSMFGASILLVGLVEFFADPQRRRPLFICSLLVGLAVGLQMRVTNEYRWDWVRQKDTYWQTYWRIPSLEEGSVLVGDGALSGTTNNYTAIFGFVNLYGAVGRQGNPPSIWYVNYYKTPISDNLASFLSGQMQYKDEAIDILYPVTPRNSVGIYYEDQRCLKVLTGDDLTSANITPEFREVARFSNLDLIRPQGSLPPAHIFGPEPTSDWCRFFEKADLARQLGDWKEIIKLKKEADRLGLSPLSANENLPFLEAYGMTGAWQNAIQLSLDAYKDSHKVRQDLCIVWGRLGKNSPDPAGYQAALNQLNSQVACP